MTIILTHEFFVDALIQITKDRLGNKNLKSLYSAGHEEISEDDKILFSISTLHLNSSGWIITITRGTIQPSEIHKIISIFEDRYGKDQTFSL